MAGSKLRVKVRRFAARTKKFMLRHGTVRGILELLLMLGIFYFLVSGILVLAFRTDSYWMAVISDSMKHDWGGWDQYFMDRGYDPSQFPLQGGFERGDLLVVQGVYSVSEVDIGDVVVMDQGPGKIPLVHRVVEMWEENGEARFMTRGDSFINVSRGDFENFKARDVLGKVVFVIPKIGHIALWFQGQ